MHVLRDLNAKPFLTSFLHERNIAPVEYTDSKGEQRPHYELTERQALTVLPFIAGRSAFRVQGSPFLNYYENPILDCHRKSVPMPHGGTRKEAALTGRER